MYALHESYVYLLGISLRAEEFAARGCTTYATARSLEKMCGLPESIHKLVLDVTLDSSVNDAVSAIMREQGQIDILVNNAGISRVGESCRSRIRLYT